MVGLCEAKKKAEMRNPIWEVGEKGVLLVTKRHKRHKRNKKMTKKCFIWALTNTDFLPRTNADFLQRITGGGSGVYFLGPCHIND
jgi:hypothetical protein